MAEPVHRTRHRSQVANSALLDGSWRPTPRQRGRGLPCARSSKPSLLAGIGVKRDDTVALRAAVDHGVHVQRRDHESLASLGPRNSTIAVGPLPSVNVLRRDPVQRREARTRWGATIVQLVATCRGATARPVTACGVSIALANAR
jgi:hypothetical protein